MTRAVSQRAYAKHRGVDRTSVRDAVAAGRLAGAVLPDGRIDVAKADAAWKVVRGPGTGAALADARREKSQQELIDLAADVRDLEHGLVDPRDAGEVVRGHLLWIALHLRVMALEVPDAPTRATMDELIAVAFHNIRGGPERPTSELRPPASPPPPEGEFEFDSAEELSAQRARLQARQRGLLRELRAGRLVEIERFIAERLVPPTSASRSALLAARVARDRDEAVRIIRRAITALVGTGEFVTVEELLPSWSTPESLAKLDRGILGVLKRRLGPPYWEKAARLKAERGLNNMPPSG